MFKPTLALHRILTLFSAFALFGLAVSCISYLFSIEWIDHVEPLIASISWISTLGLPVYHSMDSAERYSNLYGPFLYFFTEGFLKTFGPSFFAAKLGSFVAILGSLLFFFLSLPKTVSRSNRFLLLGWLALIYLSFAGNVYWIRPEPWMLLTVAILLWAAQLKSFATEVIWAIGAVILAHLKLHAVIYALPALALIYQNQGLKAAIRATAFAAILLPLPALLIPNFSATNLFLWIRVTSQHGIEIIAIFKNLGWCIFFSLPLLLNRDLKSLLQKNRVFVLALIVTFALGSTSGALRGAGKYHILPPLMYLGWWLSTIFTSGISSLKWATTIATASLVTLAWNAQRVGISVWNDLHSRNGAAYYTELNEILDRYPKDWIQMGFGHDYAHTFYRPLLVFKQDRIFIDGATLMDFYTAGLEYTPATLESIRRCQPSIWVFPKGDTPFDLRHAGSSTISVFRPEIQNLFFQYYSKQESTAHYDLWKCL